MVAEQRDYKPDAQNAAEAIEEAKAMARAEGRRVRTLARIRTRGTNGRYTVTLAVDADVPEAAP